MKRVIVSLFIFIVTIMGVDINANAENNLCNGASSAILYETNTDTILYEKDINKRVSPASMTKIMTLLLIYEDLEKGIISKETVYTITYEGANVEGSKAYLSVGEQINVDELIKCITIASANDAAKTMAIELAGSEELFAKRMNEKVLELGLKDTMFSDCTGLASKNHYTSAYDLAIISKELITKYPDVLNYTNIKEDYIRKDTEKPFWLVNTNKLIGRVDGVNGLKTGFTSFSRYCITLHMEKDNMDLISVVFGYDTSLNRNKESLELLRYGMSNYKVDKVLKKGEVLESFNHILFKDTMDIKVKEDIYYLSKKTDKYQYAYDYSYDIKDNNSEIKVYLDNKEIYKDVLDINLNNKKNIFELMLSILKETFCK